jgi:aminoglycoside 3-N-acetyltransferase I
MSGFTIRRLGVGDEAAARGVFRLFAEVFEDEYRELSDAYLGRLLGREDFRVLAAMEGDRVVGGITGHVLPMTRGEESELFLYDLAVGEGERRRGIGRALVRTMVEGAAAEGIGTAFVPAENEDTHALEFYRAIGGREEAVTLFLFP